MEATKEETEQTARRAAASCGCGAKRGAEANNVDDPFKDAEVVFRYTDDQAVADGVLKRFETPQGHDTRHRITGNAYEELTRHHARAYADYGEPEFMRFFLAELLPLVPEAVRVYRDNIGGGILKTDYDFRVTTRRQDVLWHLPNEIGGVTVMKPEDY